MAANEYGYGIHGPTYSHCPNCGAETHPRVVTTPHVGIKTRRCYDCCPWWRTSGIPQTACLALLLATCLCYMVVSLPGTLGLLIPDWAAGITTLAASAVAFRASGPKPA